MSAAARPGTTVRLRRGARGTGEPVRVLALHGLAGSGSVWQDYEQLALEDVEFWEARLPWGAEGHPGWSHRDDPAQWVASALDSVPGGVDVLIAHSFAAGLALETLAGRRSRRSAPRAVVVVSPFHRTSTEDFGWNDAAYYLNGFHRILEEGLRVGSRGRLSEGTRQDMALRVRDRVGPYGWQQFFGAYLRSPFLNVGAIRLPVLVMAGEDDFSAPPDDARALAGALPDAHLELLADCGHFAMAEQPRRFADAVHELLRECFPSVSRPPHPPSPSSLLPPYVPELT
ncbi:alpha/beta fold hydrolase [Streptomyces sp. NPDC102360]|uniref:alpha/beta fold hydrolase n=1 Tax=Streptomyces sp. NPDC102360 TaxID=3366160 RepID=UPI0037FA3397